MLMLASKLTKGRNRYPYSYIVLFTWSCIEAAISKREWQEQASAFCQRTGIWAAHVTTIFVALDVLHRMEKRSPIRNIIDPFKREPL